MRFNVIDHPAIFSITPIARSSPAWWGHIPFANFLVSALRPSLIVELGVFTGGSFSTFCQAALFLDLPTIVVGIDHFQGDASAHGLDDSAIANIARFLPAYPNARLIRLPFDEAVTDFVGESINLLHIDGNHSYESVKHDYETWLPKLAPEGVVLFHDTTEFAEGFGVHRFWAELGALHPSFEFIHAHGLGVLAPKGIPASLEPLFGATTLDRDTICDFFDTAASSLSIALYYRSQFGDELLKTHLHERA